MQYWMVTVVIRRRCFHRIFLYSAAQPGHRILLYGPMYVISGCTIEIGQVTIHDGDLIFGDIDGVLVIPKEIMHEVLEKALIKASGEKKVRNAIENGMSATEAFATFGIL